MRSARNGAMGNQKGILELTYPLSHLLQLGARPIHLRNGGFHSMGRSQCACSRDFGLDGLPRLDLQLTIRAHRFTSLSYTSAAWNLFPCTLSQTDVAWANRLTALSHLSLCLRPFCISRFEQGMRNRFADLLHSAHAISPRARRVSIESFGFANLCDGGISAMMERSGDE